MESTGFFLPGVLPVKSKARVIWPFSFFSGMLLGEAKIAVEVIQTLQNCIMIPGISDYLEIDMRYSLPIGLLLFLPAVCFAADEPAAVPEPPELPLPVQSGEEMEPDITIIRKGTETIQEYRRNGRLYMVKIIPQVGPPYYMLDTNGDGEMDVKKNDIDKTSKINMWKLFEWDWP
jgi:hypothetical protein